MRDILQTKTVALPSGLATTTTAALDLEGAQMSGKLFLVADVPATPTLANTKTLTVAITECDTLAGSYTAATGYGNMVITGPASGGGVATIFTLAIHPSTKRYVKATFTGQSAGGDLSAVTATFAASLK